MRLHLTPDLKNNSRHYRYWQQNHKVYRISIRRSNTALRAIQIEVVLAIWTRIHNVLRKQYAPNYEEQSAAKRTVKAQLTLQQGFTDII
jgi:hypothetical protein